MFIFFGVKGVVHTLSVSLFWVGSTPSIKKNQTMAVQIQCHSFGGNLTISHFLVWQLSKYPLYICSYFFCPSKMMAS